MKQLGTGKSTWDVAHELGLNFQWPADNPGVLAGIDAVRLMLPKCWFDKRKTARLVECLRQYRKGFNSRLGEFTSVPVHNFASHAADSVRVLAVRHKTPEERKRIGGSAPIPRSAWA